MKFLLLVDLEGVSGVVSNSEQAKPGSTLYREVREYLAEEVESVLAGAREAGAELVYIFDMHYYGLNLFLDRLPNFARPIMGKPRKIYPFFRAVYQEVEGLMMVGFHSMMETLGGLLTHTYDHSIKKLFLNDLLVGEIGMEAAIAGFYGVPIIFLSGDSKGVEETKNLLGEVTTVVVKEAINEHSALCFPLALVKDELRRKAFEAVAHRSMRRPFTLQPPYRIRVEFFAHEKAEKMTALAGIRRLDDKTVETEGEDLPLLWENFIGFCQDYD